VGSVVMGLGQTDMCKRLQNFVMLLGLDFMPPDQIANMSLNGLRRRVATRDKTQTGTQMDEPLVALDLGHWFHLVGPLHYHFFPKKHFVGGSSGLGFFSMRHSANFEQEVIFKNIVSGDCG
jgi:hypothetical protein